MDEHNQTHADEKAERIRRLLHEAEQLASADEKLFDEQLIAAHPELMPELGEELAKRRVIRGAAQQAAASSVPPGVGSTRDSALHVRCPHCQSPIELVADVPWEELICPSCGSSFNLLGMKDTTSYDHAETKTLGHFELIDRVGMGAFGTVWMARDLELDRTVALKIPRKGQLSRAELERFMREARAAAQLRHPHIVSVHEVGRQDDTIYIVSDFVHGATLADWLTGQRLSPREGAELCVKLAEALHHAHELGVVHRDLKPSNIMLDCDGAPHLMDFGLAKREAGEITMTLDGKEFGTPAYMSPEQARGEAHQADRRSDIYSLGVILFELLTNELPFRGNRRMLTLQILNEEPPSPRKLNSAVPRDVETICLKCLEKDAKKRYQTAAELAADLRRFVRGEPITARPVGRVERTWRWCKRQPVVAGLAAAMLLTLAAGTGISTYFAVESNRESLDAKSARDDATKRLWGSYLAQARAGRWSGRAGRRSESLEAVSRAAAIRPSLELRNEAVACMPLVDVRLRKEWKALPTPEAVVAFDQDLERFAFGDASGSIVIRRVSDQRELARWTASKRNIRLFGFSPDGRYLATSDGIWDVDHREQVLAFPSDAVHVSFSGNCQRAAAALDKNSELHVYRLDSREIVKRVSLLGQPVMKLDRNGSRVAFVSASSQEISIVDVGTEKRLAFFSHPGQVSAFCWSPDGRRLASACRDFRAYVWEVGNSWEPQAIMRGHQADVVDVAFSHSGRFLATESWDGTTRLWDSKTGDELVHVGSASYQPLQFSVDDSLLSGATEKTSLAIWEVHTGAECVSLHGHVGGKGPWSITISEDGRLMASGSGDGMRLWDLATGQEVAALSAAASASGPDRGGASSAVFDPGESRMITAGRFGLFSWPFVSGPEQGEVRVGPASKIGDAERLGYISTTRDGQTLAMISDGHATVIDLTRKRSPVTLGDHRGIMYVAISHDGRWVATGTWKGTDVIVWNAKSGEKIANLPATDNAKVAFSPDNNWLVTGTPTVYQFWRAGTWQPAHRIARDRGADLPGPMAFTRDGSILAIAHSNYQVRLVEPLTGRELSTLESIERYLLSDLAFSPDSSRLAAASERHVIQLWDLAMIRKELAEMRLDWDPPGEPVARDARPATPMRVSIVAEQAIAGDGPVADDDASPRMDGNQLAPAVEIDNLIGRLNDPSPDVFEPAGQKLIALGEVARAALEQAAKSADETLRRRALSALADLEKAALFQPTLISFDFDGVPLNEAFEQFARQSPVPLKVAPWKGARSGTAAVGEKLSNRPVRSRADRLGFWQALDTFCRSGGFVARTISEYPLGDISIELVPVDQPPTTWIDFAGPSRVRLVSAVYRRSKDITGAPVESLRELPFDEPFNQEGIDGEAQPSSAKLILEIEVLTDPRVPLAQTYACAVSEMAVTSGRENRMFNSRTRMLLSPSWASEYRSTTSVSLPLSPTDEQRGAIDRLSFTLTLYAEARRRPVITVDDVLQAAGKSFDGPDGLKLMIESCEDSSGMTILNYRLAGLAPSFDLEAHNFALVEPNGNSSRDHGKIQLLDEGTAKGEAVFTSPNGGHSTQLKLELYEFQPAEESFHVEFRDVPIP